jgi:hypothetical protein
VSKGILLFLKKYWFLFHFFTDWFKLPAI